MIEQKELIEALSYSMITGEFTWRLDRPPSHFKSDFSRKVYLGKMAGKVAGCIQANASKTSYKTIRLNGKLYLAHRLVWMYIYGHWPNVVDHLNGDGLDNRVINLSDGDKVSNGRNSSLSSNNTSGVNGVYWNKSNNNWVAEGHLTKSGNKIKICLGSYSTLCEAATVRKQWETENDFSLRHGTK